MSSQDKINESVLQIAKRGNLTKERRERLRAKETAAIPWWYVPWMHLGSTTGIGSIIFIISLIELIRISSINTIVEWFVIIPIVFMFSNFIEWITHKQLQHRRRRPLQMMYDTHTPVHHMVYVEEDMSYHSKKEFRLILIPAVGILGITAFALVSSFTLAYLWSPVAGWLFMLAASFYVATAELLHLFFHLPEDNFISRSRLIALMREHHAKHHDPRLMQKYNFNITFPLFDWIMGTIAPKALHENSRAKRSVN